MSLSDKLPAEVQQAYELAKKTRANAYAPYSRFLVGAALKAKKNAQIYCGCNVENGSYGATICAERAAILGAVAQLKDLEIEFLVLITENDPVAVPCGMCLQVIAEFAKADTVIYLSHLGGIEKKLTLKELLPQVFDKSRLPS